MSSKVSCSCTILVNSDARGLASTGGVYGVRGAHVHKCVHAKLVVPHVPPLNFVPPWTAVPPINFGDWEALIYDNI